MKEHGGDDLLSKIISMDDTKFEIITAPGVWTPKKPKLPPLPEESDQYRDYELLAYYQRSPKSTVRKVTPAKPRKEPEYSEENIKAIKEAVIDIYSIFEDKTGDPLKTDKLDDDLLENVWHALEKIDVEFDRSDIEKLKDEEGKISKQVFIAHRMARSKKKLKYTIGIDAKEKDKINEVAQSFIDEVKAKAAFIRKGLESAAEVREKENLIMDKGILSLFQVYDQYGKEWIEQKENAKLWHELSVVHPGFEQTKRKLKAKQNSAGKIEYCEFQKELRGIGQLMVREGFKPLKITEVLLWTAANMKRELERKQKE